eukprot:1731602-Rhodomonas_salina.4
MAATTVEERPWSWRGDHTARPLPCAPPSPAAVSLSPRAPHPQTSVDSCPDPHPAIPLRLPPRV